MVNRHNSEAWNLEAFLNSLIYELDRAQDRLSVKGLNRKLTYTVQDMEIELQLFPEFDGDRVKFTTARPGEVGASKVSFQLGSIRDNQIREITRPPVTQDEVTLDDLEMPEPERKELKKLGINSTEDLKRTVESRHVNLEEVTNQKVSYSNLANLIKKAHRQKRSPRVSNARLSQEQGQTVLILEGENLAIEPPALPQDSQGFATEQSRDEFPAAVINDEAVRVIAASDRQLKLEVPPEKLKGASQKLKVALDPYAIITMDLT
jgi:hypothetical protein